MKKKALSTIIGAILSISSSNLIASDYAVVVAKETNDYDHKQASILPNKDTGVQTTARNKTTGDLDSGDLMKENLSLKSENAHLINATSSVADKEYNGLEVSGLWSSNVNLTYSKNDKNNVEFTMPEYDGDLFLTLTLDDGEYKQKLKSILIETEYWKTGTPIYSEWQVDRIVQDWSPELETVYENETTEQTKITDLSRTKQEIEERPKTNETRNDGSIETELDLNKIETKTETGTKAYWETTDPYIVQDWTVTEVFVDWNPDASTVYENTTVDQNREVKKERIVIDQEIRPATGDIRQVGGNRTDTTVVTEYRTLTGELEYWENVAEEVCTEWVFDRYEDWTPAASDFNRDQEVPQTRSRYESRECSGQQYRAATDEYRTAYEETEYQEVTENQTVYGTKINLNDWTTNDSNGSWSVSSDGTYAYQSINGNSTVFESKADSYGNTTIKGRIRVRLAAGDDDYVGMVFGKTTDSDFYMWSWKKSNQSINGGTAYEGHFLSHVTGGVGSINWFMEKDSTGYDALDSLISTSVGWVHDVYYDFEIKYTPTKIEVSVGGTKVLEAAGSFPAGKIGFFNLSQGQVEYYKVTDEQF